MCGILGSIGSQHAPNAHAGRFERSLELLRHRGPDSRSVKSWENVKLGFCRLAILDLSEAGNQPMSSPSGRFHVVFNGQIYNHVELRSELEGHGHVFRSRSDTEVLLAAWDRWGNACLGRFVGMFAFALVDQQERRAFLGRDHVGMKPLYYASSAEGFYFASQVSALLELSGVSRRVNQRRFQQFLVGGAFDHGQATFFAEVEQVMPGHFLELDLDNIKPATQSRYWRIPTDSETELPFPQAAEKLRELLKESVRIHLRSDVPVASALSGGMDSSAIVSMMRRQMQASAELHTFTFVSRGQPGFDPKWDEEGWAEIVAKANRAVMHRVQVDPKRLPHDVERLAYLHDAPFSSPVIWVQEQVFRAAHDAGFRVMMSGQGSDELVAGYRRHTIARLSSLLRHGRLFAFMRLLGAASRKPAEGGGPLFGSALRGAIPLDWKDRVRRKPPLPDWVNAARWQDLSADEPPYPDSPRRLRQALLRDMELAPLPALLRYEDRNSMANSVEDRLPFLHPRLIEFVFSLPEEFLISPDAENKHVLRAAMRGIVPDAVLNRTDKMAFPVPAVFWLLQLRDWVTEMLSHAGEVPVLDRNAVEQHWSRFTEAGGGSPADALILWRWIFVLSWARSFSVKFD